MVIQRIQSVYLFISAVLMAVYSFLDVALVQNLTGALEKLSLFNASAISFILSILVAVLSLVTIFKYKQLNYQIGLCIVNCILIVTQLVVLVVELMSQEFNSVELFICNCMPIVSLIFMILSISAIRRDKKLLSSYDRLR